MTSGWIAEWTNLKARQQWLEVLCECSTPWGTVNIGECPGESTIAVIDGRPYMGSRVAYELATRGAIAKPEEN